VFENRLADPGLPIPGARRASQRGEQPFDRRRIRRRAAVQQRPFQAVGIGAGLDPRLSIDPKPRAWTFFDGRS